MPCIFNHFACQPAVLYLFHDFPVVPGFDVLCCFPQLWCQRQDAEGFVQSPLGITVGKALLMLFVIAVRCNQGCTTDSWLCSSALVFKTWQFLFKHFQDRHAYDHSRNAFQSGQFIKIVHTIGFSVNQRQIKLGTLAQAGSGTTTVELPD